MHSCCLAGFDGQISRKELPMKGFPGKILGISRFLNVVAGIALAFLMFLTIGDIILRAFKRPIVGTYELVAFSGAVVIGFALPLTSWLRQHIYVDFVLLRFPKKVQNGFYITTRCAVIVLAILIGWNLIVYASDLRRSGEVSATLQMPFYPIAYGVAVSFFFLCLVMVCDIIKIVRGEYE
jgi:TRAP-type C4-dicarboxylate transport system permease small subunit